MATSPVWTAEHDGYRSLDPPATHRRTVRLDRATRSVEIIDEIDGGQHDVRLAFHLGPEVQAELDGPARGPELAGRARRRGGPAGAAAGTAMEPAPRRDRPHPRLVLPRAGAACARLDPARHRAASARGAADHEAGVCSGRKCVKQGHCRTGPIMVRFRCPGRKGPGPPGGGRMSEQALDLKKPLRIVARHRLLVSAVAVLGLAAGAGDRVPAPAAGAQRGPRRAARPHPRHRHRRGDGRQ